jgi:hypothetical protein
MSVSLPAISSATSGRHSPWSGWGGYGCLSWILWLSIGSDYELQIGG